MIEWDISKSQLIRKSWCPAHFLMTDSFLILLERSFTAPFKKNICDVRIRPIELKL